MISIYNKSNISLLFLSPYVDVGISDAGVIFRQRIFETYLKIECPPKIASEIVENLASGITEVELLSLLSEFVESDKGEEYIKTLIRMGIVE